MQVELYKKTGTYQDKASGKDKQFVNFYVKCGDVLVPVTVCYFENEEGRDFQYNGRKQVLAAFAEVLPEKTGSKEKNTVFKGKKEGSSDPTLVPMDDKTDIPL